MVDSKTNNSKACICYLVKSYIIKSLFKKFKIESTQSHIIYHLKAYGLEFQFRPDVELPGWDVTMKTGSKAHKVISGQLKMSNQDMFSGPLMTDLTLYMT